MKRENRYTIIKHTDLESLTTQQRALFTEIVCNISRGRFNAGKPRLEAVVVEKDWPEYEKVWKMIEDRVTREENLDTLALMFGEEEYFPYFYCVKNSKGMFLINSDAHSCKRLTEYSGYKFKALCSPNSSYGKEVLTTGWAGSFSQVVQVSREEIMQHYDKSNPNSYVSKLYLMIVEKLA